jgi:DNA-binding NtrC family response regulator
MSQRVLLAVPDRGLLAGYREALCREQFDVTTALDGMDCSCELRSSTPQVLVLDARLPWGSGLLALIEDEPEVPFVPVILLNGDLTVDSPYGPWSPAVRACYVTAVHPEALVTTVRKVLREERERATMACGPL